MVVIMFALEGVGRRQHIRSYCVVVVVAIVRDDVVVSQTGVPQVWERRFSRISLLFDLPRMDSVKQ